MSFLKKTPDLYLRLKITNKLAAELQNLLTMCQENLYHAQELKK